MANNTDLNHIFEEAIIYATQMHKGKLRKISGSPYILHPLEVAQIASTMTDDMEVIAAAVLHDVVEDTPAGIEDIRERFGDRVAELVESETENKYEGMDKADSWKLRKEESLKKLRNTKSIEVKILWLSDKLSNLRSFAGAYRQAGADVFQHFNQKDPGMHKWYYTKIAECLEMDLNHTGAFKELIQHINFVWPGTFRAEKERFKKYKNISLDGCRMIGKGAKGSVYRYDDELIVKVYNEANTYKEIERENALARMAFVAGIPTAISFGIVTVGKQYGSMFELLDSYTLSQLIALDPNNVDEYARQMADLAWTIHSREGDGMDLPDAKDTVYEWINEGIACEDEELTAVITGMVDEIPDCKTMIHGDFHSGNVMVQDGELFLIDMARLALGDPIIELSGLYMFYVAFGELDPSMSEDFMGFSCEVSNRFFEVFMQCYAKSGDLDPKEETDRAALLAYVRLVRRCYKKGRELSEQRRKDCDYYMSRIRELLPKVKRLSVRG